MNRKKTLFLVFAFLSFAQVDYAQEYNFYLQKARQRLAEGDCTRAEASYNTYKDLSHNTNKEIERLIEECKTGGSSGFVGTGTTNGYEWVDLGLPSGTLWATCNVGASKPEDYGNLYAWGETTPKTTYDWSNYKYANVDAKKLTKYCNKSDCGNNGFTDNLTELQGADDPATSNWGSGWHTPSKVQWDELLANTTNQWTTRNGVKGRLFTSKKNMESLFLPISVCINSENEVYIGLYWSMSLCIEYPYQSWDFQFGLDFYRVECLPRYGKMSVRPVREK